MFQLTILQRKESHSGGQVCPRMSEHSSRCSQQTAYGDQNRMDISPQRFGTNMADVVQTAGRSVRHKIQQKAGNLCVPSTRPGSMEGGRILDKVGQPDGICVPSHGNPGKGTEESQGRQGKHYISTPYWPARPWFPELKALSHLPPIKIQVKADSVVQPRSGIRHSDPETLNLHAWMLCGDICNHAAHPQQ